MSERERDAIFKAHEQTLTYFPSCSEHDVFLFTNFLVLVCIL